jgi:hypothetical protein
MTLLNEYTKRDNCIIAAIVDEDEKLVAFTVTDNQLERVTTNNFNTAADAIKWADENYKGLV